MGGASAVEKANPRGDGEGDMSRHVDLKAGIRSPSARLGAPVPAICSPFSGIKKKKPD